MRKLYCIICRKYRKFEKANLSYLFGKTLVLSIICKRSKNEDEKLFKKKKSIEISKILDLIENM